MLSVVKLLLNYFMLISNYVYSQLAHAEANIKAQCEKVLCPPLLAIINLVLLHATALVA